MLSQSGTVWFSPFYVNGYLQKLVDRVGWERINSEGKYQPVRDAKVAMITSLLIYVIRSTPVWIRLVKDDPPDALVIQESPKFIGTLDITTLEITTYSGEGGESLLKQLKRTKTPEGYQKYSAEYIIVVEIQTNEKPNYREINEYLNTSNVDFPVWALKPLVHRPSTVGELTIVNPEIRKYVIDFGELGHRMKSAKMPDVIRIRRVGNVKNVRMEPWKTYESAPWKDMV